MASYLLRSALLGIENCANIGGRKNSFRKSSGSKQISKSHIPIIERSRSLQTDRAVVIKAFEMQALNKKKPVSALKDTDETAKLVDPKVFPRPLSISTESTSVQGMGSPPNRQPCFAQPIAVQKSSETA